MVASHGIAEGLLSVPVSQKKRLHLLCHDCLGEVSARDNAKNPAGKTSVNIVENIACGEAQRQRSNGVARRKSAIAKIVYDGLP